MSDAGFKFVCPYCSQHIKAFPEHTGMWINCPTCDSEIQVPPPPDGPGAAAPIAGVSPNFSENELQLLQQEPATVADKIKVLTKDTPGWGYTVLSALLGTRLTPLQKALYESERQPEFAPPDASPDEAMAQVEGFLTDFMLVFDDCYTLFTDDLTQAVAQSGLGPYVELANRFSGVVARLCDLYERIYATRFPETTPFPELHYTLGEWPAFLLASFTEIEAQLQFKGVQSARLNVIPTPDVSLCPATIHHFLFLREQLKKARR